MNSVPVTSGREVTGSGGGGISSTRVLPPLSATVNPVSRDQPFVGRPEPLRNPSQTGSFARTYAVPNIIPYKRAREQGG